MSISKYKVLQFVFSIIEAIPPLDRLANRWAINRVVNRARNRPHPLSTVHDYVSSRGLTDRRWSGRHLPPKVKDDLPDPETLKVLFERPDGNQRMCPKSTSLFPAFAQYLTDGFLRTESDGIITPSLKSCSILRTSTLAPVFVATLRTTRLIFARSMVGRICKRLRSASDLKKPVKRGV